MFLHSSLHPSPRDLPSRPQIPLYRVGSPVSLIPIPPDTTGIGQRYVGRRILSLDLSTQITGYEFEKGPRGTEDRTSGLEYVREVPGRTGPGTLGKSESTRV